MLCRRKGRLIVIELAADETAADGPQARMAALMSLYMLSVLPGRERTTREFGALLSVAGLRLDATHRLTGQKVLIEASANSGAVPPPAVRATTGTDTLSSAESRRRRGCSPVVTSGPPNGGSAVKGKRSCPD